MTIFDQDQKSPTDERTARRREFDKTPPQERVANFIDAIVKVTKDDYSPRGRQRRDLARGLMESAGPLCNHFDDAPPEIHGRLNNLLLKIMLCVYGLGKHAAPDGKKGRDAWHDQAEMKSLGLKRVIELFLEARPDLDPQVSEKFAESIKPDLLDILGKPPHSRSPTIDAIKTALSEIKKLRGNL
jgi:hypothetical protein